MKYLLSLLSADRYSPHMVSMSSAPESGYSVNDDVLAANQRQSDLVNVFAGFVALNLDPDTVQHHYQAIEYGAVTAAERQASINATPDTLRLRTLIAGIRARAEVSAAFATAQEADSQRSEMLSVRSASTLASGSSRYEAYREAERRYATARQTWLDALVHQQESGIPNLRGSQSSPVTAAFGRFMQAGSVFATAHHELRTAIAPRPDAGIDVVASRRFVTTTWYEAKARQAAKHYWHERLGASVRMMVDSFREFAESLGNLVVLNLPWQGHRRQQVKRADVTYRFV